MPTRRCKRLAIVGAKRGRDRSKKNWEELIRQDMAQLQLTHNMTLARKL